MANEENVVNDTIKPINKDAIHRICSGQVVLTLSVAVKELVENSIDAGATNISVWIKNYGMDSIEVSDNGTGVRKENFAGLTSKHFTSKIKEFADLESIGTLGFRGEALWSLCALSDLTIITRHSSSEHGTKISYDSGGNIIREEPIARSIGTTVILNNLFAPLPVRRKEFTKNHKKEFNKMCNILYAYCLVSKGIRFSCTNQTENGKKSTVVSTEGSNFVKDNIISVFGGKQLSSLIEVDLTQPDENLCLEYGLKYAIGDESPFQIEFFISSVVHGNGRGACDRQFFFINSRPCEPTQIIKLVNQIYKQFNASRHPFVFLNITIGKNMVDVNVTPDKRQIFLQKEKLLMCTIKASLMEAFKNFPSTFKMQNTELHNKVEPRGVKRSSGVVSFLDSFRKKPKEKEREDPESPEPCKVSVKDFMIANEKNEEVKDNKSCNLVETITKKITEVRSNENSESNDLDEKSFNKNMKEKLNKLFNLSDNTNNSMETISNTKKTHKLDENIDDEVLLVNKSSNLIENITTNSRKSNINLDRYSITNTHDVNKKITSKLKLMPIKDETLEIEDKIISVEEITACKLNLAEVARKQVQLSKKQQKNDLEIVKSGICKKYREYVTIETSLDAVKSSLARVAVEEEEKCEYIKFRTQIKPSSNKQAEKELQKEFSKEMFSQMEIVGQFNHAFVIARLKQDLFIIDQHASDEKYNYEDLQKNTILESQQLVNPKDLQLTCAQESVVIEHEELFKKNGFHFLINHDVEATKKIKLTKVPLSKNYIFGKDDVDEMIFMIEQGHETNYRPSKLSGMFASRACRKSIMVGRPLTQSDMQKLVVHMGEIEQPWNCPHGRPTMRHLVNLDLLQN